MVLTADSPDTMELVVSSRSVNGWVSPDYRVFLGVLSGPKVTATVNGAGAESEFVLTKRLPETAGFTYQFDYGDYTTVPATSAGTATVTWTPTTSGSHVLTVWAIDADGNWINYTDYAFDVA